MKRWEPQIGDHVIVNATRKEPAFEAVITGIESNWSIQLDQLPKWRRKTKWDLRAAPETIQGRLRE